MGWSDEGVEWWSSGVKDGLTSDEERRRWYYKKIVDRNVGL